MDSLFILDKIKIVLDCIMNEFKNSSKNKINKKK